MNMSAVHNRTHKHVYMKKNEEKSRGTTIKISTTFSKSSVEMLQYARTHLYVCMCLYACTYM